MPTTTPLSRKTLRELAAHPTGMTTFMLREALRGIPSTAILVRQGLALVHVANGEPRYFATVAGRAYLDRRDADGKETADEHR